MAEKIKVSEARAQELGQQVLAIEHSAAGETAGIGVRKMAALASFFATATPEEVHAATDRKLQGVPAKTSDAVFLSNARAVYRLYGAKGADWFALEILSLRAGWKDLIAAVRSYLEEQKADDSERKLREEAEAATRPLCKGDPNKHSELMQDYMRGKRELAEQEAAKREAEKHSAPAVAAKIAAGLIESGGYDYALAVAAALEEAIYKAREAAAKPAAVAA